jgi:hypothetical protein
MDRQQNTSRQQAAERKRRERDEERGRRTWADEAAQARTGDDPRAVAPHDKAGKPSIGPQF